MSEHAPPAPPHPRAAAKHLGKFLSGRPAWQYIAGITFMFGVAYLVYRHQKNTDAAAVAAAPNNTTTGAYQDPTVSQDSPATAAGTDNGGYQYVTPAPTQGAFAGGDVPLATADGTADSGVSAQPSAPVTVNVTYPGVAPGSNDPVPAAPTTNVTGGGPPNRPTVAGHTPAAPPKLATLVAVPVKTNWNNQSKNEGKRYITTTKKVGTGKSAKVYTYHEYESAPGKGDYGKGEIVNMGHN